MKNHEILKNMQRKTMRNVFLNLVLLMLCFITGSPLFAAERPEAAVALPFAFRGEAASEVAEEQAVKYIFFFIGDGMAATQRTLAREYLNRTQAPALRMDQFPVHGVNTTVSANHLITDSAAAGTALACGVKTNNGTIGQTPDGNRLESVGVVARKAGRKVGIVTSVILDDATPGAFYAHTPSRRNYYDIALELSESGFDFFFGTPLRTPDGERGNAYDLAAQQGYQVARSRAEIDALQLDGTPVLAVLPMGYALDAKPGDLTLAEMTGKAIQSLDQENGFFLMVEGGAIDWAGHANDAATVVAEMLAFDRAIEVAYDFAEAHPGEVLIVVTGDHETGALSMGFAGTYYNSYPELLSHQKGSEEAFGRRFQTRRAANAALSFEAFQDEITQNFGLKFVGDEHDPLLLNPDETARLMQAFEDSMHPELLSKYLRNFRYGDYEPIAVEAARILAEKSGLGWSSFYHSSQLVWTSAYGRGAECFAGMYDNTDIGKVLKKLAARRVH